MKVLLDTHALIWFLDGSANLKFEARCIIEDGENDVFVSAATAMEITTKFRIGKLPEAEDLVVDFEATLIHKGFLVLAISFAHAATAGSLNIPHKDPFDRILIAQALVEDLILISNETLFDNFGVQRLW